MKKRNILFIAFITLITLGSCNSNSSEKKEDKTEVAKEKQEIQPHQFLISDKQLKDSGMAMAKIKTEIFHNEVSAQGYLDVSPSNKAIISSFMSGKVETINFLAGNHVKKGEPLIEINNPDFLLIQQKYLKAKEDLAYVKKEYLRQKLLAADSITSQKKLQKSRNTYLNTLASYQTLKQQLILLNFNLKKIEKGYFSSIAPLYAPISGYITVVNVIRGSHVNPSDIIMEIIDNSQIHMELRVFEKDILKIKSGQNIDYMIPDMGTKLFSGYVHLIGKKIDVKSRTILVHGYLTGHHPAFITGMYVEAKVLTGSFTGLSVPSTAIIKVEENYFILRLIKHDKDGYHFERVQVIPGIIKGKDTQIKRNSRLKAGDKILGKGAFFLI